MARELSNVTQTFLARDAIVSYLLIEIGVSSPVSGKNAVYYTDAPFDITYDTSTAPDSGSNVYSAQGNFLAISQAQENSELRVSSISLTLSALNLTNITTFAKSDQINQKVSIHRVFWNQATDDLIYDSAGDTPILIFKGKISGYKIADARDTATLTLQVDSQFTNFEKVNCRRTNNTNFQREFTTDFSMEYSHETLNDVRWGKK